jgi:hypothetical protein
MHYNPACRGMATDLLNHQWILSNMGHEVVPHWAPPEPAFAQSQIPGPPQKGLSALAVPAKGHLYKYASAISANTPASAMGTTEEALAKPSAWGTAAVAAPLSSRPDVKHKLDRQVSGLRTSRRPITGEGSMMSADGSSGQSGMVCALSLVASRWNGKIWSFQVHWVRRV